jgi:AcrR family transcriptional regulator
MSNKREQSAGRGRDREGTKERLLNAATELLGEKGFDALGVNAVADRAGVSKVLIYRYFGSLEGLYEELGRRLDPASIGAMEALVERRLSQGATLPEVLEEALLEMQERLERDQLTRALLIWELSGENELTRSFARVREEAGERLNALIRRHLPKGSQLDIEATIALFSAGIYYLSLRRRFVAEYNEVRIDSSRGRRRLATAARMMFQAALDRHS